MMTTYYCIRHAEKEQGIWQHDPHLTPTGKARAQKWAQVLGNFPIDLIYCTSLRRTKETAAPLAEKLGLSIRKYDMHDLFNLDFQNATKGKTTVVVGHQNTTPAFVNRVLQKKKYPYIDAANHGNLYKIWLTDSGEKTAILTHIEF